MSPKEKAKRCLDVIQSDTNLNTDDLYPTLFVGQMCTVNTAEDKLVDSTTAHPSLPSVLHPGNRNVTPDVGQKDVTLKDIFKVLFDYLLL